nr:MAG TPA: hypothetical protein [Caudoviricetes sp.]
MRNKNASRTSTQNNVNLSACSHDLVVECILYP